ncbi:unnamed protein product [Ostreobium quekettii]|uniref:Acetyl-coenzyme A transporter 1 n=1 Tax=Ostreobium quekettii TaxID=121088 RepID=A0A8S1IT10_9CHLO|nr:unnamed protein product [Ostreobium quekettii]
MLCCRPFLLQANASYTEIGLFSITSYPYSSKLLWSPIVDAVYSPSFGRRKSWIVPIQTISALLLFTLGDQAQSFLESTDIFRLSVLFFVFVVLAATQDIAVDGWALTLLPKHHAGYAATCQTIGLNLGYFISFTVFLALNDPDFCNKHLRVEPSEVGLVTLSSYMKFWGVVYGIVTLCVALLKQEGTISKSQDSDLPNGSMGELSRAYKQLWAVVRLPAVRQLTVFLLICRVGSLAAESASPLKLLDKGVCKEALAGLVLLEFPLEIVSAVLAGRWAARRSAFGPYLVAYHMRLVLACLITALVYVFPGNAEGFGSHPVMFSALALIGVLTSFMGTLSFTSLGSFYNKISDPQMGGAYLTLLNTIANMGWSLPKVPVYWLMDLLTVRECKGPANENWHHFCPSGKHQALGSNPCTDVGGSCVVTFDGYYPLVYGMVVVGVLLGQYFCRLLPKLEAIPADQWHAKELKRE